MTPTPDTSHGHPAAARRRAARLLLPLALLALLAAPAARAGRGDTSLADSLRREIDRRLRRVEALRDSLAAARRERGDTSGDSVAADSLVIDLRGMVDRLQRQVKDLELQVDGSSILLAGPTGRLRIDLPADWERKVEQGLQEILAEIPVDTLQQSLQELHRQARQLAEEFRGHGWKKHRSRRTVGEDWVRFGEDVTLAPDERLTGDLVVLFGDARVEGRVDGSAVVIGGTLSLGPRAEVGEDAVAVMGRLEREEGSRVDGDTVSLGLLGARSGGRAGARSTGTLDVLAQALLLLVLALLAWLVLVIAPRDRLRTVETRLRESPGECLGVGLLWTVMGHVALLLVLAVLILTIVGIPLALLLLLAYVLLGLAALAVTARLAGRRVCRRLCPGHDGASWLVLPGLLLLSLPWIVSWPLQLWGGGWVSWPLLLLALLIQLVAYSLGTGAIFRSRLGSR